MESDNPGRSEEDEATSMPSLSLGRMLGEVLIPEDDWTGLSSSAVRRKLQNRLNQRAYRKRKAYQSPTDRASAAARANRPIIGPRVVCRKRAGADEDHDLRAGQEPTEQGNEAALIARPTVRTPQLCLSTPKLPAIVCHLDFTETQKVMNQFENWAFKSYMLGSPRADQLLTLIQFNVYRAMVSNIFTLGMTSEEMKEEAVSPFPTIDPGTLSASIPPNLRPTILQCTIPHHPWLDFFPTPEMRDNLLRAGDSFDEEQLCANLVGLCTAQAPRTGLIVWGEPSNPHSWEATEGFVKNWGWVLKGCREIIESTNHWRAQRGEKRLRFDISVPPSSTEFSGFARF